MARLEVGPWIVDAHGLSMREIQRRLRPDLMAVHLRAIWQQAHPRNRRVPPAAAITLKARLHVMALKRRLRESKGELTQAYLDAVWRKRSSAGSATPTTNTSAS